MFETSPSSCARRAILIHSDVFSRVEQIKNMTMENTMRADHLSEQAVENGPLTGSWFPAAGSRHPESNKATVDVTENDAMAVVLYLEKALAKAEKIREQAPAGSYLSKVLSKTIDGIATELAQLKYLLAHPDVPMPSHLGQSIKPERMRPAN
jgi:hypothetical protein